MPSADQVVRISIAAACFCGALFGVLAAADMFASQEGPLPASVMRPAAPAGESAPRREARGTVGASTDVLSAGSDVPPSVTARVVDELGPPPARLFRFEGLPAGLTVEQVDAAWQRASLERRALERRSEQLERREQELRELEAEVDRRFDEVRVRHEEAVARERRVEAQLTRLHATVTVVRREDEARLRLRAAELAAMDRARAVAWVEAEWATPAGQEEVVRVLEFVEAAPADEILAGLSTATLRELVRRRLRVHIEPVPSDPRD